MLNFIYRQAIRYCLWLKPYCNELQGNKQFEMRNFTQASTYCKDFGLWFWRVGNCK